jgi:hypothetical protein
MSATRSQRDAPAASTNELATRVGYDMEQCLSWRYLI